MKIFFIGTVEFSKCVLTKLIEIKAQIVGVATKSDSPFNADFADVTHLCKKANIPYRFVDNINDRDVIFCFGWSELLKKNCYIYRRWE